VNGHSWGNDSRSHLRTSSANRLQSLDIHTVQQKFFFPEDGKVVIGPFSFRINALLWP
jgi:hypothetical protein